MGDYILGLIKVLSKVENFTSATQRGGAGGGVGGGAGRCDSPSLYGHMQPGHGHKRTQAGKTCSFRAYVNTAALGPTPSPLSPNPGRKEEGKEKMKNSEI